jgi:hypothetical protein
MTSNTCIGWTRVRWGGPRSYLPHGHPSFGTFVFGEKTRANLRNLPILLTSTAYEIVVLLVV